MKTYSPKPEQIERRWYLLDASGQVLGRLASEAATLLRGKHKPMFAPHMDTGDHVVVINADKIELTGNKAEQKVAWRHSGYPGGIKGIPYTRMLAERPVAAIEKAVRGMLPKNSLGRQMLRKLHVVAGPEHPHAAQKPVALAVGERPPWDGLPAPKSGPQDKRPAERTDSAKPKSTATEPAKQKATATKLKATAAKPKDAAKPKPKEVTAKTKATVKTKAEKAPKAGKAGETEKPREAKAKKPAGKSKEGQE